MTLEALPDIPRAYTGLAEWAAVLVYILILHPRFTGWRRVAVLALAAPAMVGLQLLLGQWPLSLWVLGMATAVLAMFALIYLCTDTTVKDAAYVTAHAFVLAELVASLEWQLWVHWEPSSPSSELGTPMYVGSLVLLGVAYGLGFGLAYVAERRNFGGMRPLGVEWRPLVTAFAIAAVTFLVSNLSFLTTNTPFSGQQGIDVFYIRTLVDLAGFVGLYSHQSSRNRSREAMELAEARVLMEAQHQQYLQSKRNIDNLNRMHHDLKHYAAAIRAEESAARRSQYLQALEDSLRGYESEIKTGNLTLDVILSAKMERCLQEGIAMTLVVDGAALEFMDAVDLSVLFGNALDNAIEASLKVPEADKRIIKVDVYTQNRFVLVKVENYFPYDTHFVNSVPRTTKSDRARHGFGVTSMRAVVGSYGGSLRLAHEDEWFVLRALLPQA